MPTPPTSSLYNHGALDDDDFVANFVARHATLEALVRRLTAIASDSVGQHHVLIGPRGMGKTSLLRRLAIAINRDPALSAHFVPLNFREEQYNVLRLADFWRNCAEALAEWTEAAGSADLADRLDDELDAGLWDDETAGERFATEMSNLGRRAVLLVDNIDLILEALPENQRWALRRYLQASSGPIVIGAATRPLTQAADRDEAFYEFFQPHYLDALDERETERCMRSLAERREKAGLHVLDVLNKQPERLRTLHTLTGGNPRILTLIYRLLESEESAAAMADLERLLDQVTPYYKARIEEYQTAQQRAVIDAIALNWDPITSGALSQATGVTPTTLSPLLIKLRNEGLIDKVETSGSYSGYQLVERFLNIWYLMRHGTRRTKQRMRWLVGFLTAFYSPSDLARIAQQAKLRLGGAVSKDYELALNEALTKRNAEAELEDISAFVDTPPAKRGDPNTAIGELLGRMNALWKDRNSEAWITAADELFALADSPQDPAIEEQIAMAMYNKGVALRRATQDVEAVAAFDAFVARFSDSDQPVVRRHVARALVLVGLTYRKLGNMAAELAAYDDVLGRFADDKSVALREQALHALLQKGVALERAGDRTGAIAMYDGVLARFDNSERPLVRELTARASVNKGYSLSQLGEYEAAIAAYDAVMEEFGDADAPSVRRQLVMAMVNKGVALGRSGDRTAEIAAYDATLTRFGEDTEASLQEHLGKALLNKGYALRRIDEKAEALATYEAHLRRFGEAEEPALQPQIAKALFGKAFSLAELGKRDGEREAYDEIWKRFSNADQASRRVEAAKAMLFKAASLEAQDRPDEEADVYDLVIGRYAQDADEEVRNLAAMAAVNKGATQIQQGDLVGAIATYDVLIDAADAETSPAVGANIAMAMFNRAVTFSQMEDEDAAIAAYDGLLVRYSASSEAREFIVKALINRGVILEGQGREAPALASYEEAIALLGDTDDEDLLAFVADAQVRFANALVDSGGDLGRAEALLVAARAFEPLLANANLAWLYLLTGRADAARDIRTSLDEMPAFGLSLLEGALSMADDNFGSATEHLAKVLGDGLDTGSMHFADDLDRFLRLASQKGYGEHLLTWFESTKFSERHAPLYVAFRAYVRGGRTLLDANVEVRSAAREIFEKLDAPRRDQPADEKPSKRRRGRPRK